MKKLFTAALISALALSACNSEPAPTEAAPESGETATPAVSVYDAEDFQVSAASELIDNTNIGFNYSGAIVADQDFSTAWCSEEGGDEGQVTISFTEPVKASHFGIVPGFARDESIFNQNNRIQELEITFDGDEDMTAELKDEYGMQFVEFDQEMTFQTISFEVEEVYDGSKYDDTCIAEIDFTSDYVKNKDAQAALNYYETYKKANALKPYDIVSSVTLSDVAPNSCGEPSDIINGVENLASDNDDPEAPYASINTYVINSGNSIYLTAKINEFGSTNDKISVKVFYSKGGGMVLAGESSLYETFNDINITRSCNGQLYAHVHISEKMTPRIGQYHLEVFNEGKKIGSTMTGYF